MSFKRFAKKKGEIPRQDRYWTSEMRPPLDKPEPAKKKAVKRRLPKREPF